MDCTWRETFVLSIDLYTQGPGKKWEHYELNKNGKPVRVPMHVKTGDLVQVCVVLGVRGLGRF